MESCSQSLVSEKEYLSRVKEKLKHIRSQLAPNISLLAVSKGVRAEHVRWAHCFAAQNDFGESKVQELLKKSEALHDLKDIHWHFIGHLQKNKVKALLDVPGLTLLHSLDSLALAEKLNHHLEMRNRYLNVLIQVNSSREKSKHGSKPEKLFSLVQEIIPLKRLSIQGLMSISKWRAGQEERKASFQLLRALREELEKRKMERLTMGILSMGMSSDYKVALSQGSTMVRIGRGIFGEREK